MSDEGFIYLIVALNILVQLMLIHSLRFPRSGRRNYYLLAIGIPVTIMLSMRLMVTTGAMHLRVAEQSAIEHLATSIAGVILMAGPWFVTFFAIVDKKRRAWVNQLRAESEQPV